jgi:hypothetical protein
MTSLFERLKELIAGQRAASQRERPPRKRDSPFIGGTNVKDIEDAPPERAGELAGHPVERVDT